MDSRAPVCPSALGVDGSNLDREELVLDGSFGRTALRPGVVATPRNAEQATQHRNRKRRALRVDELEPHELSFTKNAAAFLRNSHSPLFDE
jgi:hypothetical protein